MSKGNHTDNPPDTEPQSRIDTLSIDDEACYRALMSRDRRFDGKFFVGVSTTGIYCRPVCRVRSPMQRNCNFFETAAEAEVAGFRPCLLCKPENAPAWSNIDISEHLASAATELMRSNLHSSVSDIAERLGVSDRHLRRVFESRFGIRPINYLQTQRRLMAKRLLGQTELQIAEIAIAAGFGSARRLNASFKETYGKTPREFRNTSNTKRRSSTNKGNANNHASGLNFILSFREPYDFKRLLGFLSSRTIDGVEYADESSYSRIIRIPAGGKASDHIGWLRVSEGNGELLLSASEELAPCIATVISRVRHIFDLDAEPSAYLPVLGKLAEDNTGIRLPGAADGFELAVRAVLGQQITVKAARTLATRFVDRFGEPVKDCEIPQLTYAFPSAAKISRVQAPSIAKLGIIRRRADTIRLLAKAIDSGDLDLSPAAEPESTIKALCELPGIGEWTAHYLTMRALHWPDAFPAADYGVMKALGIDKPAAAKKMAQDWRPWRAYAVMHLWNSLHKEEKA